MNGLQRIRQAILNTFRSYSTGPKQLPPLCHSPDNGIGRLSFYDVNDHKQDVVMRSNFLPIKRIILTPVKQPPSPAKIKSTLQNSSKSDVSSLVNNEVIETNFEEVHFESRSNSNSVINTSTPQKPLIVKPDSHVVETDLYKPLCILTSTPRVMEKDASKVEAVEKIAGIPSHNGDTNSRRPQQVNTHLC